VRVVIRAVSTHTGAVVITSMQSGLIIARARGTAADIRGRAVRALSHQFVQFVTAVFALNIPATTHPAVVTIGHGEGIVIIGIGTVFPGQ